MTEIIANESSRKLVPGWGGRISAALVWDGTDEVRIPSAMGTPRADQMQGTARERLVEAAGRVCYDGNTELLTEEGWVKLRDLSRGVPVATYNRDTDAMEFQEPVDYIRKTYRGQMYRVDTSKVSVFVTPDHELWVGSSSGKTWGFKKARDVAGIQYTIRRFAQCNANEVSPIVMMGRVYQQKNANKFSKGSVVTRKNSDVLVDVHQLDAWASLLGWYVSEGTLNMHRDGSGSAPYVAIYQKEARVGPIIEAAEQCGLNPRVVHVDQRNDVAQVRVGGATLARYLEQFGKGSRNKRLPRYVFKWPVRLRERLLDALMAGDGTVTKCNVRVYNTNSKGLADDVQELIVGLGRPAMINHSVCETCVMYRVRETAHRDAKINHHGTTDCDGWVDFDGDVFCVSVPNRILVTRRDDKIALCGNCYDSLGKGRSSVDFHEHLRSVHRSPHEHAAFTIEVNARLSDFAALYLNKPCLYVRPSGTSAQKMSYRVTANLRHALEWNREDIAGDDLRSIGHQVAPEIIREPGIVQSSSVRLVEPETDEEKWITLYLVGDRGWCYDAETEVLTDEGWKTWPDVQGTERFATLAVETETLEFQHATDVVREPYHGEMYCVASQCVDLKVTPNHRMVVRLHDTQAGKRGEERLRVLTADEVEGRRVHYKRNAKWAGESPDYFEIPDAETEAEIVNQVGSFGTRTVVSKGRKVKALGFARFLGYWLAEGSLDHQEGSGYATVLYQKRGGKAWVGMHECLADLGLSFNEHEADDGCVKIRVNGGKALFDFLKPFYGAENKAIPTEVKKWAPAYQKALIEAHLEGDGSCGGGNHAGEAHTVSKRLADDLQEAALKAGWSASIRVVDRRDEPPREGRWAAIKSKRVAYVVGYSKSRGQEPLVNHGGKKHDRREHYSGMVYCVTVPNGTLYVRRNGKPCWSGNSHELVRHGDWTAISQRSTRYVDESESEWVLHPLLGQAWADAPKRGGLAVPVASALERFADLIERTRGSVFATESLLETIREMRDYASFWTDGPSQFGMVAQEARVAYFEIVRKLQMLLEAKGVDKTTARKQARGAARGILGNALETEVIFSFNVAQARHMLSMRAADAADATIRLQFAEAVLPCLRASRYGDRFADLELQPAGDGIGRSLKGGGAK